MDKIGFSEIRPIPSYNPAKEGYEETFADWNRQVKGEYPLQLMSLHVQRRAHSNFDNTPWLREAFDHQAYVNPVDAKAYGLKDNDTVLISTRYGKVLRRILVTDTIRQGVVAMGPGGCTVWDDALGIA